MVTALLLAALSAPQAPAWTPPAAPDPTAILSEARQDTSAARYETALAKFLWFHYHAKEHDQGLGAVRLSFALAYWRQLADRYPPALDAMKRARDRALTAFGKGRGADRPFSAFHDFASINGYLKDEALTVRTFVALDRDDPAAAESVFHVVEEALVRAKAYDISGKYVRPDRSWETTAKLYRMEKQTEERFHPERAGTADQLFTSRVATLVALLVVNGRPREAYAIAEEARLQLDAPAFCAALDSALGGAVPESLR